MSMTVDCSAHHGNSMPERSVSVLGWMIFVTPELLHSVTPWLRDCVQRTGSSLLTTELSPPLVVRLVSGHSAPSLRSTSRKFLLSVRALASSWFIKDSNNQYQNCVRFDWAALPLWQFCNFIKTSWDCFSYLLSRLGSQTSPLATAGCSAYVKQGGRDTVSS